MKIKVFIATTLTQKAKPPPTPPLNNQRARVASARPGWVSKYVEKPCALRYYTAIDFLKDSSDGVGHVIIWKNKKKRV